MPSIRLAPLLAALCVTAPLGAQQNQPPTPLAIGTATAAPGARASGWLEVPAGVDPGTRIPITVVRGRTAGPTLALVAGTQGGKVAPVVALQELRRSLDPARLRGTVLLVHVANVPSFLSRMPWRSPVDGKNGNRVYPGRADGTVTERIAHAIATEIVARADYLIDLHAADANEAATPFTFSARPGANPRTDSLARAMAVAWGSPHVVWDADGPREPGRALYLQTLAHLLGKPALTTMVGGGGVADAAAVRRNVDGAERVLRHLGMLPGEVEPPVRPLFLTHMDVVGSPATGTWRRAVEPGRRVRRGEPLGRVHDFFGEPLHDVLAPFDGVVLYVTTGPAIAAGEPLLLLGGTGGAP